MTSGVYKILNLKTKKCYIGSSNNISVRFCTHQRALNLSKHHSYKLQKDWVRDGEESFIFGIIEECSPTKEILEQTEQKWIDLENSVEDGYNVAPIAGGSCLGIKRREETKKKMRQTHRHLKTFLGKKHSEETRKKISESNKGRVISEESKEKMRKTILERGPVSVSMQTRIKLSEASRGRMHTEETKEKMRAAALKRPLISEEERKKLSDSHKGIYPSDETRRKMSLSHIGNKSNTGKKASESTKRKLSECKTGEKNHFYGKKHTQETKDKIKASWVIRRQKSNNS